MKKTTVPCFTSLFFQLSTLPQSRWENCPGTGFERPEFEEPQKMVLSAGSLPSAASKSYLCNPKLGQGPRDVDAFCWEEVQMDPRLHESGQLGGSGKSGHGAACTTPSLAWLSPFPLLLVPQQNRHHRLQQWRRRQGCHSQPQALLARLPHRSVRPVGARAS